MQYQVLARKWRPQNFRDLVGQEHVSQTLVNALRSGRIAHAFLFSGPRGSGKTTTARVLAKSLNCHAGKPGEPCGECPACTEIAAGNCMDVLEIDAASHGGVEDVRQLVEGVRYAPARDKHKIFIIDEVHMLSTAGFNALLKTLEEPPPRVVFILATTEYHKIPATILSRCQQHAFKLIGFPLILDRLRFIAREEKIEISATALEHVAFSSGGSMRDAMSAFDQVLAFSGDTVRDGDVTMLLGLIEPALLARTVRAIAGQDNDAIFEIVKDLVEGGQDLQNFCRRLLAHLRNLMVLKAGATDPAVLAVPQSLIALLKEQADLFSQEDLFRLFDALLAVESDLKYATQPRFQLEMGLIKLAQISRMRSLEDLIAEFSAMVDGGKASGSPSPAKSTSARTPGSPPPGPPPPTQSRAIPADPSGAGAEESRSDRTPPPPAVTDVKKPALQIEETKENSVAASALQAQEALPAQARELLDRITSAVEKESLVSVLHALSGAELKDETVVLDGGSANEFFRRQIRDNLSVIAQAASAVLGKPVKAALAGDRPAPPGAANADSSKTSPSGASSNVLERAKREPIVQSFLDLFPGPVKAEEIE